MHNLSTALAGIAILIALGALVYAISARRYAHSCYEYVVQNNAHDVTIKKLTGIETELTEHADSIAALLQSLHKLRSRIHARSLNKAKTTDVPDPKDDPAGWKRYMNAQIAPTARKE